MEGERERNGGTTTTTASKIAKKSPHKCVQNLLQKRRGQRKEASRMVKRGGHIKDEEGILG
jgi:hypothetical protein